MAGKFVLSKAKNGKFHFSLKAGNGEIGRDHRHVPDV
jgi:uncharacterized protein YegP (UPF0339 family)